MIKFLLGRLMQGILVLFTLYTITFFLAKAMPGEPFTSEKNVSAETKANIRKLYGLDRPLWEQYYVYPKNIITEGSLGISTSKGRPVKDIIAQSFPNS
ncbi:MAG: ABC transporter permease, partial [Verrucomicrobiota bacterium]|nr:ABC transporter permease [Verrucomicrobiota bacterium]